MFELTREHFRYPVIGVSVGTAFSLSIFLVFWIMTMEWEYSRKVYYYEGFLFWEKCKEEGKSSLQAATERYRIVHSQPNFEAEDHPDVKRGHPEAFVRGTLGYDLWDGFGYGKEPGRLETLFELHTMEDTFSLMAMMMWLPYVVILIAPFAGGLVGLILNKKHSSGATDILEGGLHSSSSEIQKNG